MRNVKVMIEFTHFSSTCPSIPLKSVGKLTRFLTFPDGAKR